MNSEKDPDFQPIRSQYLIVTQKIDEFPKTIFGKIKADTPVPLPHVIPEEEKHEKSGIKRARKGTHKYNTRSRVNYVTTFKNLPKMFKMDVTDTEKPHIG